MDHCVKFCGCLALAALQIGVTSNRQATAQDLTPSEAKAIAFEAYVYGFPIVENYKRMYAFAIDEEGEQYKAPFNTLKNKANVFTPADTAVVTPNCDTPYSVLWMDLRAEPLVLGVPEIDKNRYYSIQLIDLNTFNFDYIGSRVTGNGAAQFLIAGPNWTGETPDNIDKVIHCETEFALAIYRTQLFGASDLENVRIIQNQYAVRTLSEFSDVDRPDPIAAIEFPPVNARSSTDFEFFKTLNFVLQFCPMNPTESELRTRLARIGVVGGKPFDANTFSPEIQEALKNGMAEGEATIVATAAKANSADVFGSRGFLGNVFLKRAVGARIGLYGNSKEEALYPLYLSDAEGKPLDGSKQSYVINFAADQLPPVDAFWSVTVYDVKNQFLVSNPIDRYFLNSSMIDDLKRNADGGLTLFIQHESPGRDREANWLPIPDGPFYMMMRLYWPKPEALDATWTAPLVWPEGGKKQEVVLVPEGVGAAQEVKPSVLADEPKPEMERPSIWGEPTEVKIGLYIIDVDEVNSADQSFAASVFIQARWKNPFLRHKGPGPMHRGITEVWTPRLTIIGQQNTWRSYPESVEIQPDGEVIYRQKMWGHFSQPLELQDFPFDKQDLIVHVVAAGLAEEDVRIVTLTRGELELSSIAAKFSVPDFEVVDWEAGAMPYLPQVGGRGIAGYQMRITMKRSPTYYIYKVIVPLCLIVIMSWLPRWIATEQIGTNIGISTTAFLTLVAYLFAITVLLPRVSYFTRMDRFILLSTLTVFISLIQTVANTSMIHGNRKVLADRLDWWSRGLYPLLLAVVLAVSFWI